MCNIDQKLKRKQPGILYAVYAIKHTVFRAALFFILKAREGYVGIIYARQTYIMPT